MNLDARVALPKANIPKIGISTKMLPRRKAKGKDRRRKSQSYKMKRMRPFDAYVVTMKRRRIRTET